MEIVQCALVNKNKKHYFRWWLGVCDEPFLAILTHGEPWFTIDANKRHQSEKSP